LGQFDVLQFPDGGTDVGWVYFVILCVPCGYALKVLRFIPAQSRRRILRQLLFCRLRSLHLQFIQTYIETENDFAKALALEPARRAGREIPPYTYWPQTLLYSEHVRYVEQLRRYEAAFPREQLLVLAYDDFRADNEATVRQVLRFLEVDDTLPIEPLHVNPTVRARSQRAHELLHAVSVGRGPLSLVLKSAIKTVVPQRLRRRAVGTIRERLLYAEPAPEDAETTAALRRRFKPEVVALADLLDRDLVRLWGYDSIA